MKEGLGFLSVALLGFAGIALFVGSFIIWNTFSMQVAQRTRELALLRAIGATRRQVMRAILAEALVLGLVASALGVVLGLALARGLSALMTALGVRAAHRVAAHPAEHRLDRPPGRHRGDGRRRGGTGSTGDPGAAHRGAAGRGADDAAVLPDPRWPSVWCSPRPASPA